MLPAMPRLRSIRGISGPTEPARPTDDSPAAGLMPFDDTIGGLVGRLDVLRIECPTCGRRGRYLVACLVAGLGPKTRLTDWLNALTADCPQKIQQGVTRACGAHMPDLVKFRDT